MSESACRAVLDSYDSQYHCSGGAGHDGPHRCEVCLTTWTKP